jgi:hypothetical protein
LTDNKASIGQVGVDPADLDVRPRTLANLGTLGVKNRQKAHPRCKTNPRFVCTPRNQGFGLDRPTGQGVGRHLMGIPRSNQSRNGPRAGTEENR